MCTSEVIGSGQTSRGMYRALVTAAEWHDAERVKLSLEWLKDPAIVHFIDESGVFHFSSILISI
jgi:hypothetical protein